MPTWFASRGARVRRALLIACFTISGCASVDTQTIFSKARERVDALGKLPTLESLIHQAPVTTSFADATTEVAFLDAAFPEAVQGFPLAAMPRDADGNYLLSPGLYEVAAESYCIQTGTHAPGTGDGYLYAPIRGPKAGIVQSVLRRSAAKPEIPQHDVQLLLWAIIARTRLRDMPAERQRTATALLTPKELFDLNGGALGLIPPELLERYLGNLPPEVRKVFELEQQLRQRLTTATATYEQIEQLAVLAGIAPPGHVIRPTPRGRWSYHPSGYFVRFFPSGYQRSRLQVYIPPPITVERDAQGRVLAIDDGFLLRVETKYGAAPGGQPPSSLAAHTFTEVQVLARDSRPRATASNRVVTRKSKGTVLVAHDAGAPVTAIDRLPTNLAGRRERLASARTQLAAVQTPTQQHLRGEQVAAVASLTDYAAAVRSVFGGRLPTKDAWVAAALPLLDRAADAELYGALAGRTARDGQWQTSGSTPLIAPVPFDPTANVAAPANTSSQRLVSAGVPEGRPGEHWYESLPDCPCRLRNVSFGTPVPDKHGRIGAWKLMDSWVAVQLRRFFHPGADAEIRWTAPNHQWGQQCTYKDGALITEGLAAGTPDFYAPGNEAESHFADDVVAYTSVMRWFGYSDFSCDLYFQMYPPNRGAGCQSQVVSPADPARAHQSSCKASQP